jgi:hypothetical protein
MDGWRLPPLAASFLGLLTPCFLVERITNDYFLTGNPLYGSWSGPRIDLLIVIVIAASLLSGAAFGRLVPAAGSSISAILAFLFLVYVACDPRICYSAGLDGLEPLRMAFFLSSVAVAAGSSGVYLRKKTSSVGKDYLAVGFATFVAIAYVPVIFTFAGARLLAPSDPWAVGALLFVLSFSVAATGVARVGRRWGVALPMLSAAALMLVSEGIASAYLSMIVQQVSVMALAVVAGSFAGAAARARNWRWARRGFAESSVPLVVLVLLLVVMTYGVIPDASVGLFPSPAGTNTRAFTMGVPVMAGAFMDAPLGATKGVSLTLSFAGTNASVVQEDNFLAAGIGAHSPGCCVDGIDYGYRFDVYVFHQGNMSLAASAWKVCDHNAACGGHSWKVLMFQNESALPPGDLAAPIHLTIRWEGHTAYWNYSVGSGPSRQMSSFSPEKAEKAYFNTGMLPGGATTWLQSGSYFFQYGVLSRYPIGHGGWSVSFSCPATLVGTGWSCIAHARTLQGGQSFWKVIWRWGEDYPNVEATPSTQQNDTVTFSYSVHETMGNFVNLW